MSGRAAVIHLGCKVNRTETDGYERALAALGYEESSLEDADVIVVNTCTVTAMADKKARKAVRGALRANAGAPVIVTGCAAAVSGAQFARLSPRVEVVAGAAMADRLQRLATIGDPTTEGNGAARWSDAPRRPSVKVQDGCDNRCAYCIVPTARGHARSVEAREVARLVRDWAERGAGEIVLSGINLGAYDDNGRDLAGLLKTLLATLPNTTRLRLSSIEPDCVTDELIELIAESDGRICRWLHLPLQSGSDAILESMGRRCHADAFLRLCERLYEAMPTIALGTDLIVGFPGETERDFEATLDVARRCRLSRIHSFTFSARTGTPAATYADAVPPECAHERARRLRALGEELASADLRRRFGACETVLIEAFGRWRTESYHLLGGDPARVPGKPGELGPLIIDGGLRTL